MNLMLACPQFSEALRLEENRLHTFVFENPTVCRAFLADILHQKAGGCGEIVLSEAFEPISMQKYAEILLEPLTVQPNTRPILTKLYAQLEQVANDEVHFVQYADLQRAVSSFLLTLTESQETELSFSESMVLSQVFKAADLQFDCSAERPIAERLLDYMIAARTYLGTKLFVFYNLKSLLSEDELKCCAKNCFTGKYKFCSCKAKKNTAYPMKYSGFWTMIYAKSIERCKKYDKINKIIESIWLRYRRSGTPILHSILRFESSVISYGSQTYFFYPRLR